MKSCAVHNKTKRRAYAQGFTIVEVLTVIIIVAILATITVVSYNVVVDNSRKQAITADLLSVASQVKKKVADGQQVSGITNIDSLGVEKTNTSGETTYGFFSQPSGAYCVSASGYNFSFYVTSTNSTPIEGSCSSSSI